MNTFGMTEFKVEFEAFSMNKVSDEYLQEPEDAVISNFYKQSLNLNFATVYFINIRSV